MSHWDSPNDSLNVISAVGTRAYTASSGSPTNGLCQQ